MTKYVGVSVVALMLIFVTQYSSPLAGDAPKTASIYNFVVKDIDGKDVKLSQYQGKVLLIVNVASKCGNTPQYEGLQKLYMQYKDKGLVVLGFPANNFKDQEPGSDAQIKEFCSTTYGVTFPMFSKISVKGDDIDPLYQYLTSDKDHSELAGEITWNFNKFLVDPSGKVVARFATADKPESEKVISAIQKALK
jgi:glutathione peroxidase